MEVFKRIDAKSEAELVARIISGDRQAEETLAERYRPGVIIIITRACGDSNLAQDLCQDAFVKAFQAIRQGRLREPEKLPAFIWKLAHNIVTEHFRMLSSRGRTIPILDNEFVANGSSPFDLLLEKEKQQIVRQALSELKPLQYRTMLYRYYIDEEDKESICKDLGLSSRQFNVKLCRARKQFYEKISKKPESL